MRNLKDSTYIPRMQSSSLGDTALLPLTNYMVSDYCGIRFSCPEEIWACHRSRWDDKCWKSKNKFSKEFHRHIGAVLEPEYFLKSAVFLPGWIRKTRIEIRPYLHQFLPPPPLSNCFLVLKLFFLDELIVYLSLLSQLINLIILPFSWVLSCQLERNQYISTQWMNSLTDFCSHPIFSFPSLIFNNFFLFWGKTPFLDFL